MWYRRAKTDRARHLQNISRLQELHDYLNELKHLAAACQSCAFASLNKIIDLPLVRGRPAIHNTLQKARTGPMHQKVVLDSPSRFSSFIQEAMDIVKLQIMEEDDKNLATKLEPELRGLQRSDGY